jgi:radical SAM protein with 4Fe4S-binding SPASM domain
MQKGLGTLAHNTITIYYEVTTACPCSCFHCHIPQEFRQTTPITRSFEDFAIDLVALKNHLNIGSLILSGGEPTLHKDIFGIVELASRQLKKSVSIISNCINPSTLRQLSKYATIWCSLDFFGEKQDKWRGFNGLWNNYQSVQDIANVRATLLRENLEDVQHLIQNVASQQRKVTVVPYKGEDPQFAPSPQQMQKLLLFIFHNKYGKTIVIDSPEVRMWLASQIPSLLEEAKKHKSLCAACESIIRIDPNGNVKPCQFLEQTIGDALDSDLKQKIADARQKITDTYMGKCASCNSRTICGGCKATRNSQCFLSP